MPPCVLGRITQAPTPRLCSACGPAQTLPQTPSLPPPPPTTQELARFNILGAPVTDATTGEYAGIIDVGNILGALVEDITGDRDLSQLPDDAFLAAQPRLSGPELQRVGEAFTAKTLGNLLHSGDL